MFSNYKHTALERFLRYVQFDTQSDPQSTSFPSTERQKDLSRLLVQELQAMGIIDAHMDDYGYVYATIAATSTKKVPVICFCSHIDTAPDCSGSNVRPLVHKNYQGQDIVLPDDPKQVLTFIEYPALKQQIGNDIVTASGTTLLGSDDKAGIAEIMDFAHFLQTHKEIPHGVVKILFTPDEEVGKGADHVDLEKLGADFAYTVDGGEVGSIDNETFSADKVEIIIQGVISHPGSAKGKLINALKIAAEIVATLPKDMLSPETTEGKEGFIHPVRLEGVSERCVLEFIIRDFDTAKLQEKEQLLKKITETICEKYPKVHFTFCVQEQYRNMKEVLDVHPKIVEYAKEAMKRTGLSPKLKSIRGGTDGSRLSFMGLPCPNLSAGQQAIHSKLEFISVQDMNKVVQALVHLSAIWEEKS